MIIDRRLFNDLESFNDLECPEEYGIVFTPHGTIAPGAIIAAIAASLHHQDVELNQIIDTIMPGIVSIIFAIEYILKFK